MSNYKLAIILSFSIILNSCSRPEDKIKDSLSIEFYNHVNGIPLVFDSTGYSQWFSTMSNQNYNIYNLYYLVTDIKLTDNNGNTLKILSDIHFVNSDNMSSNFVFLPETLKSGEYSNIEFVFGLNQEKNKNNEYLNEDFHNQMFWPEFMGGGYHYMKLEGKFNDETNSYATHTGGLNSVDFSIAKSFPINIISSQNGTTHNIRISMNLNNWYSNPNSIIINSDGIMGNALLQQKLKENGEFDVFNAELLVPHTND